MILEAAGSKTEFWDERHEHQESPGQLVCKTGGLGLLVLLCGGAFSSGFAI